MAVWLSVPQFPQILQQPLDVVFLLYDLTHLLQWQVMLLISITPTMFQSDQCTELFFHHWAVYINYFCLLFPTCCADVPIPCSSPVPPVHTTLLPSSTYTPAPASANPSLSSPNPNPAHLPCHQPGDTWAEVELPWSHSSSWHFPITASSQAHTLI